MRRQRRHRRPSVARLASGAIPETGLEAAVWAEACFHTLSWAVLMALQHSLMPQLHKVTSPE